MKILQTLSEEILKFLIKHPAVIKAFKAVMNFLEQLPVILKLLVFVAICTAYSYNMIVQANYSFFNMMLFMAFVLFLSYAFVLRTILRNILNNRNPFDFTYEQNDSYKRTNIDFKNEQNELMRQNISNQQEMTDQHLVMDDLMRQEHDNLNDMGDMGVF